jgi:hypothetical protein
MANTYTLIASYTVGSGGAANIEFTSIPATYTDLLVKVSPRGDSGGTDLAIQFNGSTSSVYTTQRLYGTGSSTASSVSTSTILINNMVAQSSYTASTFGNGEIYIPNYTSSNAKSVSIDGVTENNATASFQTFSAGLWNPAVQAAITSIKLMIDGGANFVQYSTAYLYGISNS